MTAFSGDFHKVSKCEAHVVCVLREHGQAEREEVNRDIPGAVWLNRTLDTCWNASWAALNEKIVTAKLELRKSGSAVSTAGTARY